MNPSNEPMIRKCDYVKIKRMFKKLAIVSAVGISLISLSACQNNQQRQAAEQAKIKRNGDTASSLPSGNYFQDDNKSKVMKYQQTKALKNVAEQMNNNYRKIGNVRYDQKADSININLKGAQMEQLVSEVKQGNGSAQKFWSEMTTGVNKTSKNISKQTRDDNVKFTINNTNGQQLFSTQNGNVQKNTLK